MAAHGHHEHHSDHDASGAQGARDPVCGMTVNPHTAKHRHTHAGRPYYFCSARCREKFIAEPTRYLEPQAYQSRKNRVDARRAGMQGTIENLTDEIRSKLDEAQVPVISIDGRVKRLYSFCQML